MEKHRYQFANMLEMNSYGMILSRPRLPVGAAGMRIADCPSYLGARIVSGKMASRLGPQNCGQSDVTSGLSAAHHECHGKQAEDHQNHGKRLSFKGISFGIIALFPAAPPTLT